MSIVEQINQLEEPQSGDKEILEQLQNALFEYHNMIKQGILVPRKNKLQNTYSSFYFTTDSRFHN